MTTPRWRGTLIYTGTLATLGTIAVVRFGPLVAGDGETAVAAPAESAVVSSSSAETLAPVPDANDDEGGDDEGDDEGGDDEGDDESASTTPGDVSATPATPATPASPSPSGTATPADGSTTSSTVTVTGAVSQTRYGPVQVSVTFTGTQIIDVQTLQSPNAHRESAQISARSTPLLAQEVVAAQSAAIDTVSGATYTSEAYRESVQSAIDLVG